MKRSATTRKPAIYCAFSLQFHQKFNEIYWKHWSEQYFSWY